MAARRTPVTLLLSLIAAIALLVLPVSTADAHTRIRDLEPADGSALDAAPSEITMIFTDKILAGTARVRVSGPDGEVPVIVSMSGRAVSGALPSPVSPGAYTVTWRVAAADGHPISGTSTFTVLAAPTLSPAATPSDAASSIASTPIAAPAANPFQTTTEPLDPLDPASALDGAGTGTKIAVSLAAVLTAAAAIGGVIARRRLHRRRPGGESP